MTKDLTTGKPMRMILQFSIPLIFGNLFQQMYNMIDTMIVGRCIGLSALTSVGATASINFLIIGFCLGTCSGLAIPVAQQFGAKKYGKMRGFIMNAAYLSILIAVVLTIATCVLCDDILIWMKTPEQFYQDAYDYMLVIFIGIPCTFLYNVVAGIIRALGDSKTPFYFLVLSTVLNIALDFLFILPLQMGTAGAAWATILAQAISGICCLIYMKRKFEILKFSADEKRCRADYMKILVVMGVPMGLQYSITAIGSIMLQSAVNVLGAVYVSAFTVGLKVKQLAMCPYDAFATASATFGGQNLGAGKLDRIKKGLFSAIWIAVIYSIGIGFVLVFAGSKIALLFMDGSETDVLAAIQQYLTCSAFFYSALAFLNCTRMTIQGIGYSSASLLSGLTELIARAVMSIWVIPVVGYTAVCFTDQTAWVSAAIVVMPMFFYILKRIKRQHGQA